MGEFSVDTASNPRSAQIRSCTLIGTSAQSFSRYTVLCPKARLLGLKAMFSLPAVDPMRVEGSGDDNPIVLEDTLAHDFRAFLRVIYPIGVEEVKTFEEWVGVLRLADKWSFGAVRQQAFDAINPLMSDVVPHKKLSLGSTFHIQPWISEGLIDIAMRCDLELDHLQTHPYQFNDNTIAKLFYIQSKAVKCQMPYVSYIGYRCSHCGASFNAPEVVHYCDAGYKANVTNLVQKCFVDEIRDSAFAAIKLE